MSILCIYQCFTNVTRTYFFWLYLIIKTAFDLLITNMSKSPLSHEHGTPKKVKTYQNLYKEDCSVFGYFIFFFLLKMCSHSRTVNTTGQNVSTWVGRCLQKYLSESILVTSLSSERKSHGWFKIYIKKTLGGEQKTHCELAFVLNCVRKKATKKETRPLKHVMWSVKYRAWESGLSSACEWKSWMCAWFLLPLAMRWFQQRTQTKKDQLSTSSVVLYCTDRDGHSFRTAA